MTTDALELVRDAISSYLTANPRLDLDSRRHFHPSPHKGVLVFNGPVGMPFSERNSSRYLTMSSRSPSSGASASCRLGDSWMQSPESETAVTARTKYWLYYRVKDGRPHVVDAMLNGEVALMVNTSDDLTVRDSVSLRRTALLRGIPYFTTIAAARAAAQAISALAAGPLGVRCLQGYNLSR